MLGIFGGSFDPVHLGHIKLALALLEQYNFEQIQFIPCQQSPLKEKTFVDARHRWEMLRIVTRSYDRLTIDDRELKRPGPSYTIDTLKEIHEETQHKRVLVLILGVDTYLDFCKWYHFSEILSFCHVMLLQRSGYTLPNSGCEKELYDAHKTADFTKISSTQNGYIFLSDIEKFDISSTTIRDYISEGKQPKFLLPGNIWNYISKYNLYQ